MFARIRQEHMCWASQYAALNRGWKQNEHDEEQQREEVRQAEQFLPCCRPLLERAKGHCSSQESCKVDDRTCVVDLTVRVGQEVGARRPSAPAAIYHDAGVG
jgi:hypothetical protein